ncbi:fructose 1,6-bisphosphatase, partial [bacterium]
MVAELADDVFGLGPDVGPEGLVAGEHGAGEHEVLPDDEAELVAEVVKLRRLVDAAAPDAEHVHVGLDGRAEQALILGPAEPAGKAVGRNPIRALGEKGHAVCGEIKARPPPVGLPLEPEFAEADAPGGGVEGPAAFFQADFDGRQVLRAQAGGPPQPGPVDADDDFAPVSAFLEREVRGAGPGSAGMEIEERPSEPFIVFMGDKTSAGSFNMPLYKMFADHFTTAGLVIAESLHAGFSFEVQDVVEHNKITLTAPEEIYDLLIFLGAPSRYAVKRVFS